MFRKLLIIIVVVILANYVRVSYLFMFSEWESEALIASHPVVSDSYMISGSQTIRWVVDTAALKRDEGQGDIGILFETDRLSDFIERVKGLRGSEFTLAAHVLLKDGTRVARLVENEEYPGNHLFASETATSRKFENADRPDLGMGSWIGAAWYYADEQMEITIAISDPDPSIQNTSFRLYFVPHHEEYILEDISVFRDVRRTVAATASILILLLAVLAWRPRAARARIQAVEAVQGDERD